MVRLPAAARRLLPVAWVCAAALPAVAPAADAPLPTPPGASWSWSLRSTAYAYQTEDAAGSTSDHLRFFEHYAGTASGLAGGGLTVRIAGRFADALDRPGWDPATSRLATGLADLRVGSGLHVQAGRQFLQSGVAGLTLDGARVAYVGRTVSEASAWAGAAAPADHAWAMGSLDDDAAAGGRVVLRAGRGVKVGASAAYRERYGRIAERPVGVDATARLGRHAQALARAAFDLEGDRWQRLEAQARWRPGGGAAELHAQVLDRYPTVDAASWFSRFTDLERVRLARAALRWENPRRYGAEVEYVGSFTGARTDNRVGLAALLPMARVGWSQRVGDAGDESTVYGEVSWQARPWLRLEGEASYLTYALFQDAPADDERDLTTLAGRARIALRSGLNVTAEVQSLDNPGYDKDVRVLVGVDLAMGRGASRFGLDRGGWLR
ncbi:MAG TPA: hypothetical protein PLQ13_08105 [Candidatus Krumholzibacteria bacterium]|nr:hypothetical protein [Candidatus Krumholzibacteria bacterium]